MNAGNCVGLHPYGPCPPGVGCNAAPDPVGLRVAELEAEVAEQTQIIQALEDELNEVLAAGRAFLVQIERNGPHGQYVAEFRAVVGTGGVA